MTKLMEWVTAFAVLFAVWLGLVTNKVGNEFTKQNSTLILISPIIVVGLFGLYAATVVLYRVFTFNNCEEASNELKTLIKEAREDLKERGYKFKGEN